MHEHAASALCLLVIFRKYVCGRACTQNPLFKKCLSNNYINTLIISIAIFVTVYDLRIRYGSRHYATLYDRAESMKGLVIEHQYMKYLPIIHYKNLEGESLQHNCKP